MNNKRYSEWIKRNSRECIQQSFSLTENYNKVTVIVSNQSLTLNQRLAKRPCDDDKNTCNWVRLRLRGHSNLDIRKPHYPTHPISPTPPPIQPPPTMRREEGLEGRGGEEGVWGRGGMGLHKLGLQRRIGYVSALSQQASGSLSAWEG